MIMSIGVLLIIAFGLGYLWLGRRSQRHPPQKH